jgi:hypothetical protein
MEESTDVREAVLDFYWGVTAKAVERFDDIVSTEPTVLVIGTAPGEWVTERARLKFGFQAEGLTLEPGPTPTGYRDGSMGWFVDEPWYGFPGGGGMRTRLTAVVRGRPLEDRSYARLGWGAGRGGADAAGPVGRQVRVATERPMVSASRP